MAGGDREREWPAALVELYRCHFDALVRSAQRIVQDPALAEDCVQEVFVSYYRKRPVHAAGATLGYLRAMTRNAAISKVRAEARQQRPILGDAVVSSPEDVVVGRIAGVDLAERVIALPQRQSQVIGCRLRGLSVEATAQVLDISAGSVKTHRFRAAAALRDSVGDAIAA
ncbi:MAG: sigma-70 family RNA polymerase sigma factor [Actinomycetota bacterium]